jgi:broad specificity phosphatase PhoE
VSQTLSPHGRAAQRHVFLVTHGRTICNTDELGPVADEPLDDVGRVDALALAENLAYVRPTRIISSPLQRAKATAEVIAAHAGTPVSLDHRLGDRKHGQRSGYIRTGAGTAPSRDHEEQADQLEQAAESVSEVVARARAVLDEQLPGPDSSKNCAPVVLVTHPEVARLLLDDLDPGRQRWHESSRRTATWSVLAADGGHWLIQDADETPAESQPGE